MQRSASAGLIAVGLVLLAASTVVACPPSPLAACRLARKNVLKIARGSSPDADRMVWSWRSGPATSTDFGDPASASGYELCVYGASGLLAALAVPHGGTCGDGPCWRATSKGFVYRGGGAGAAGVRSLKLVGVANSKARVRLEGRGPLVAASSLPFAAPISVQLTRSDGAVCFESVLEATAVRRNDTARLDAHGVVDATTPMPPLPSAGCGVPPAPYPAGVSTVGSLVHDGLTRTFRVYVPPSYDASGETPAPVLLLLHGGFGSGAQIESSSRMRELADAHGFVLVSPDGVASPGGVRTWNGGGCCGYSLTSGVDDVGFAAALLDDVEGNLCLDRRRAYAAGMSNGAILSHRLACDLAARIRAVGSVAGAMMADPCTPARPVPVIAIHGTGDLHVPFNGGMGCGAAGVPFPSVSDSVAGWMARDGCAGSAGLLLQQGDTTCETLGTCAVATDVAVCTVPDGGHQWPGGEPPAIGGLPGCAFGYQSESFSASQALWQFFRQHPPR